MPKPVPEKELRAIEDVLVAQTDPVSRAFIADALGNDVPQRTLQLRLRYLVDHGRVVAEGQVRAVKYRLAKKRYWYTSRFGRKRSSAVVRQGRQHSATCLEASN
ncbi:hypothetical protein BH11CYA1_BH11CYA1_16230 [soil metagenome]